MLSLQMLTDACLHCISMLTSHYQIRQVDEKLAGLPTLRSSASAKVRGDCACSSVPVTMLTIALFTSLRWPRQRTPTASAASRPVVEKVELDRFLDIALEVCSCS